MRVAIIGANGQLGTELVKIIGRYHDALAFTHEDCEVTSQAGVTGVRKARPDCIINTAAMHDLTACEENPREAWRVNTALPLVEVAHEVGAAYIYISTDYVFDGAFEAYTEKSAVNPLSVYGRTKLAGELTALLAVERSAVCRVAYLFGVTGCRAKGGGNFVEFIVGALRERRHLDLDADTVFSPTSARDAAWAVLHVAEKLHDSGEGGVYHCANHGVTTHYDFGITIAQMLRMEHHFSERRHHVDTLRPRRSGLLNTRLSTAPHWHDGLRTYLEEKGYA